MSDNNVYLAVDIGAGSGRIIAVVFDNNKISIEEVHRFPNTMKEIDGKWHWNIHELFSNIIDGLKECYNIYKDSIISIAIDTWGVDFGLLNSNGEFLGLPYSYRNSTTENMNEFIEMFPDIDLYKLTGIQLQPFNTLFQLYNLKKTNPELVEKANKLLFMPDIFNYLLTSKIKTEYTFATTTQLLEPSKHEWLNLLIKAINIPRNLFQDIVEPGTKIGLLKKELQIQTGLNEVKVIATASHDTGSAVVAVPASSNNWAFLSSGTWSLLGMELDRPIINDKAKLGNFTNEGGANNTIRFLKNIMGLWIFQQCFNTWDLTIDEVLENAKQSTPFKALIDPNDNSFFNPQDMITAIKNFCRNTDQEVPESPGEITRCILESLAFEYKMTLSQLQECTNTQIDTLHVIGGGSQNKLLSQFTADACGVKVVTGPVEATAIGNIMIQIISDNKINSISEARKIIASSFELQEFLPNRSDKWSENYKKFLKLKDIGV